MLNFIGLHPKLYSFDYERIAYFNIDEDGIEIEVGKPSDTTTTRIIHANKNTAKGVRDVVAKYLSFDNYEICFQTLVSKEVHIKRVGSDHCKVFTYSTDKIELSAFNTKRWICDDGIHTYAFGHWRM